MNNIDKEKINNNINEAYEKQSKKVKELLQSAKENLADQKECTYNYVTNKEKANQLYKISRVVTKKKSNEAELENRLEDRFDKMNEKIDISSKNLNFIFENVTQNNNNVIKRVDEIKENNEVLTNKLVKAQLDTEKSMLEGQNKVQETLLDSHASMENSIKMEQKESERRIIQAQGILEEKIESIKVQNENKLQEIKEQNESQLEEIKEQIYKMYQKENKHAISTLLEERNAYMKELEEKDKEIRELNYKIYAYEEKLEKEIAKREKINIFASFFKKQAIQEEEPVYTSQILNYVYN